MTKDNRDWLNHRFIPFAGTLTIIVACYVCTLIYVSHVRSDILDDIVPLHAKLNRLEIATDELRVMLDRVGHLTTVIDDRISRAPNLGATK